MSSKIAAIKRGLLHPEKWIRDLALAFLSRKRSDDREAHAGSY